MLLSTLLHRYGFHHSPQHDVSLTTITADSRNVVSGSLFIALKGLHHDGNAYIPLAILKGAAAIITAPSDKPPFYEHHENNRIIPIISVDQPAHFLALAAQWLAGEPPSYIAAITGTNGKSSTADFLRQLWKLKNIPAASIGTLGLIADVSLPALPPLTTPDAISLAKTMAQLKEYGINHVAIEASSHGLAQHRLDGLPLKAAGFSNITRDHLDYHGTVEAYRNAKLRLFEDCLPLGAIAAFNADMDVETVKTLYHIAQKRGFCVRDIGHKGQALTINAITALPTGQSLKLSLNGQSLPELFLPLIGQFQAENALLAAALCWQDQNEAPAILSLLSHLTSVPGRCELVATLPTMACAYIDYAHTPDALEHILLSLRVHTTGRIILVFGAGGNRDQGKRPLMGQIASHLADKVIITDDNPRYENPATIRSEIRQSCPEGIEIPSRHEAIAEGLKSLNAGDILLVAGKGHEKGQIIGDIVQPFDDRDVIRSLVQDL